MLHPNPHKSGGIQESCLIDFDFSCQADSDKYPLSYAEFVSDVSGKRAGKAGEVTKKEHDWQDFGSVLALFFPSDAGKFYLLWANLSLAYTDLKVAEGNCTKWIHEFIKRHKDINICLVPNTEKME